MTIHKAIVTHKQALRAKYGSGWRQIDTAIAELIAADAARGINTALIALDLATDMKRVGGVKVTQSASPEQTKTAVDAVYQALKPQYLLLLGAPDVIPHQALLNPVQDEDPTLFSDLPYACEVGFSSRAEDVIGPTRVVGRLPDIVGAREPSYLLALLRAAAQWRPRARSAYDAYFAVSAKAWQGSTRKSVQALFGEARALRLSPAEGPLWPKQDLQPRIHFLNLHGALEDSHFYGQDAQDFPIAHQAAQLSNRIRAGTVVAAECCYGAELFDPAALGELAICNTYLAHGAYGFWGSTTIAYGPADTNGEADYICQFFLRAVRQGASLGRAALQARQDYIAKTAPLSPIDLKTLAQFYLLGDPSIQPVKTSSKRQSTAKGMPADRAGRRAHLQQKGRFLRNATACVTSTPDAKPSAAVRQLVEQFGTAHGLERRGVIASYAIHGAVQPTLAKTPSAKAKAAGAGIYHVVIGARDQAASTVKETKVASQVVLLVKEIDNKIAEVQELHRR